MKHLGLAAALLFTFATVVHADPPGVVYTPGGSQWAKAWQAFYSEDNEESQISVPLTKAGAEMVPAIIEAIAHKDMKHRRYAIGALGLLRNRSALEPLTTIVEDESEEDYFRGDALVAVYHIDSESGTQLANKYAGQGDNLKMMTEAVLTKEPWLTDGPADFSSPMRTCDGNAFVIDPDPQGLNVRNAPRTGKVIGNIPKNKYGSLVHLVAQNGEGGWLQINKAQTAEDETVFDQTGWVSGNMLGVLTRAAAKGVSLYEGGEASAVLTTIPAETEVKIVGCDRARLQVKYKDKVGWLNADDLCADPAGECK